MNEMEFTKARSELAAYRKVHFYLSHIVRYFQNLERQQRKPNLELKLIYSNLPEVFSSVNNKVKEYSETVQMKDTKLWKHVLRNWRLMGLKNVFLHKGWTDPFQWPAINVEILTECGVEQNIAEIFVNNVNVWSRTHWKIGSTVEAWICDQQCWAVGSILQIENESGCDRLIIGYDNGTRNMIKKTSKYLRPTVEKRDMKKEWCYGLKTIKEDVNGEFDQEIEFLKNKNADLETIILELQVKNQELLEENKDMSSVLERHCETFERYQTNPELVLDCEERRMDAEEKFEALMKKQNVMVKQHQEEINEVKTKMQKEIDDLKKQLRKSALSKKSKHRVVKRGKTCPQLRSHKSKNHYSKKNNVENQKLYERVAMMKNQSNRRKNRVIRRQPSSHSKRKLQQKHSTAISTTMKKLPLEPSSFSHFNCQDNMTKESYDVSIEENENCVAGAQQNLRISSRHNINDWNSKSPRFRSISSPMKKTSRKFGFDNKVSVNEGGVIHSYSADNYYGSASPQTMKTSQLCDDLVFLASRVTALQDRLKAYHHSQTRSRSISNSRSRSSSSDSEDVGMEDYTLEDIEKHLKCKQQENQNMLQELEMDIRNCLLKEFSMDLFPALLSEVQSLKSDFQVVYAIEKKNNGGTNKFQSKFDKYGPQKNNNVQNVHNPKNSVMMNNPKNDINAAVVVSSATIRPVERKKSPQRMRNRGKQKDEKSNNNAPISNSKPGAIHQREDTKKSPAKETDSKAIDSRMRSNAISETITGGNTKNGDHDNNMEIPPLAGAVHKKFTTKIPPPSLHLSTVSALVDTNKIDVADPLKETGGDIMKSPRNSELEVVPQLVY